MAFEEVRCFVPLCDGCGPDWLDNYDHDGGEPHFVNVTSALKCLADNFDWRITTGSDGETQMRCPSCAARDDCLTNGHKPHRIERDDKPPIVFCDHCNGFLTEAPPAGSPESMAELPLEQEKELAALEAMFAREAT